MTILSADVGGTNTRIALCDPHSLIPRDMRKIRNVDFDSLGTVLARYVAEAGHPSIAATCVAVAGPVRDGVGQLTNLDWSMDAPSLTAATGAPVGMVLNDLEAQGHALPHVAARRILGNRCKSAAAQLVVGIGTGFNAAPVHPLGDGQVQVAPSECGHVTLPVWDAPSLALAQSISARSGFASVEEVLSGRGLLHLYNHFAALEGEPPATSTVEVITALGTDQTAGQRSARFFATLLGRVLGDLTLIHLPWGGLYLIGGLARAITPFLAPGGFEAAFLDKGRFSDFLRDFSIFLVEDDFSALIGCASYARSRLNGMPPVHK
ncbi:MAG: glucokinase [Qingshengfaniella sp.]